MSEKPDSDGDLTLSWATLADGHNNGNQSFKHSGTQMNRKPT